MIHIQLVAFLGDLDIAASVKGSVLTINGEDFDFGPLNEGERLPYSAIASPFFVPGTYVERKNKDLYVSLYFPVLAESPEDVRNPQTPIVVSVNSGKVNFPDATPLLPSVVNEPPPAMEVFDDEN